MTLKLSFVVAVAGAALLVALPAHAKGVQPVEQWQTALEVRGEALNTQYGLGDTPQAAVVSTFEQALQARGEALNQQHGLGGPTRSAYVDAHERAALDRSVGGTVPKDAFERAAQAGISRSSDVGLVVGDDHVRIDPADLPVVVTASPASGSELEWPQIGIGFGIGILLVLGLALTMRLTGVRRPLAH